MGQPPDEGLDQLLAGLAGQAGEVDAGSVVEGTEYRRAGRPFAVGSPEAAEFRLHPEVAEAARRTPDAGPSTRGDEWVRFVPRELDGHARDRAEAWFLSAWRHAAPKT